MKRFYILFILLSLTFSHSITAQIGGRGAYSFLDATTSSRVAALGGSMVPIKDDDLQLTMFNPSLISSAMNQKLSLSYVDYFADINFASIQYAHSFDEIGNFTAGVQYHNYGQFDYTDEAGNLSGSEFGASDYAIVIGWGRQLDSNFSIGANAKFVGSQYESYHSYGIAVDVAGSYITKSGWLLSLTARNIGTELKSYLPQENSMMPFSMQFGVSKRLDHVPFRFMALYDHIQKWDLTYDESGNNQNVDPITGLPDAQNGFEKFGDQFMRHIIIGTELYIGKNLTLRGGYNYKRRQELQIPEKIGMVGFSWGMGIRISKFQINYSRSTYHVVGSPNYLTLNINLNDFTKK